MMPNHFKAERQSLCVKFAIEINKLCNNWVSERGNKRKVWKLGEIRPDFLQIAATTRCCAFSYWFRRFNIR